MGSKQTNPAEDLFEGVSKIIEYIEVKDLAAAKAAETDDSKAAAEMWIGAVEERDSYITYLDYWEDSMFQEVLPNATSDNLTYWKAHPLNVPLDFRDTLLTQGRNICISSYIEQNDYYRKLIGLPVYSMDESCYLYLTEELANKFSVSKYTPIHELSSLVQNSFMATDEYQTMLEDYPDHEYLKYIGSYKVDLYVARKALDFELIRYDINRSDINPNLVTAFSGLYVNYREYVMSVFYNSYLESVYANYRNFIGLIIKSYTLLQISNKAVEAMNSKNFLDDTILHMILSMYGIPDSLIMTTSVRRKLVKGIYKLIQDKATNSVYYDIADILGYQDIVVSKLMLLKNQQFGDNGQALFDDGTSMDTFADIDKLAMPDYISGNDNPCDTAISSNPNFVKINIKDEDPYQSITEGSAQIYSYEEIISNDPMWWDMSDTQHILKNSYYTEVDSKYIILEVAIHQIKYLFESIYFTRMILDNREYTDEFSMCIPEILGIEPISLYDLMVFVLCATCMNDGLKGTIISDTELLQATAGFNFDMDQDLFVSYLDTCKYADVDRIKLFITDLTMKDVSDVSRLFNDVMYPMREWLELKLAASENKDEFIEYENIYRALFTYDANNNSFIEDFKMPMTVIMETYNLSQADINAYSHFYPRTISGTALTEETIVDSLHYSTPFVSNKLPVTWYVDVIINDPDFGIVNRGTLYFHDILNSTDLRELVNEYGDRIFMDYEDETVGWQLNTLAMEAAIQQITQLKDTELSLVTFQCRTTNLNYSAMVDGDAAVYNEGDYLPASIRANIFKDILIDKLTMDLNGLAVPPTTYLDYLYRKNITLYDLLVDNNRFEYDKEKWLEDIMCVVLAIESELGMHVKYFEQAVVGQDMFFKPLLTLISHFKSTFVDFAKTGLSYIFGDKIDAGGNSNMIKLFDTLSVTIHFVVLAKRGYESQLGLYDVEHQMKYHLILNDIAKMIEETSDGKKVYVRQTDTGSIRIVDEMKFFKNGQSLDPEGFTSSWLSGEPGTGRWESDDEFTRAGYITPERIAVGKYDMEAWKYLTESAMDV